jgi:hypothetical protein
MDAWFRNYSPSGRRWVYGSTNLTFSNGLIIPKGAHGVYQDEDHVIYTHNEPGTPQNGEVRVVEVNTGNFSRLAATGLEGWSCDNGIFAGWFPADTFKGVSVSASGRRVGIIDLGRDVILRDEGADLITGPIGDARYFGDVLVWSQFVGPHKQTFGRKEPGGSIDNLTVREDGEFYPFVIDIPGLGLVVFTHGHADLYARKWGDRSGRGWVMKRGVTDYPTGRWNGTAAVIGWSARGNPEEYFLLPTTPMVDIGKNPGTVIEPPQPEPPRVDPALTITSPNFPLEVSIPRGQKYPLRLSWKATAGSFTELVWTATGTSNIVVKTPASVSEFTLELPVGDYYIRLAGAGPDGSAQTGAKRSILVREESIIPEPQPEPEPSNEPQIALGTNDKKHFVGAHEGGGVEGVDVFGRPSGLAYGGGTSVGLDEGLRLVKGAQRVAFRANNGAIGSPQPVDSNGQTIARDEAGHFTNEDDDGIFVFNRVKDPGTETDGWEGAVIEQLPGGAISVTWPEFGTRLFASDQGGGKVGHHKRITAGIDEMFWPQPPLNIIVPPINGKYRGPIRRDGRDLRVDDGRFRLRAASLLTALSPQKDKATVLRVLDWFASAGFNAIRVFAGNLTWAGQTAADARERLPWLLAETKARGMYVLVSCLTDTGSGPAFNHAEHISIIAAMCEASGNTMIEIANEPYHETQADEVHNYGYLRKLAALVPTTILVALGAASEDEELSGEDARDWIARHLDRGRDPFNEIRRIRELENVESTTNFPVVLQESTKAEEIDQEGKFENSPYWWHTMGLLCRGFEVDAVFHSEDGLHSRDLDETTKACARAFIAGITVVEDGVELTFQNATWSTSPVKDANFAERPGGTVARVYSFIGAKSYTVAVGTTGDPGIKWQNKYGPTGDITDQPELKAYWIAQAA